MANPACAGARRVPRILSLGILSLACRRRRGGAGDPTWRRKHLTGRRRRRKAARHRAPADRAEPRRHGLRFQPASDRNPAAGRQPAVQPADAPGSRGCPGFVRPDPCPRRPLPICNFASTEFSCRRASTSSAKSLQTRLAHSVALITGALPAQYGLRTAGIIDIQTKTGTLDPGGSLTMYGGSQGWFQPSVEFGGRVGQIDYYVTGEFLHNHIGIENPTPQLQRDSRHRRSAARLCLRLGDHRSDHATDHHSRRHRAASSRSRTSRPDARPRADRQRHQRFPLGRPRPKPAPDQRLRDRLACRSGRARSISRSRASTATAASTSPRETRSAILYQRHRPDRLPAEHRDRRARATAAGGFRPSTRAFQRLSSSRESARRSAPTRASCRSTRSACRPAINRSRSSIPAARPDGSTAIICRTNGRSFRP